jgi:hypothetical protein
MDRPVIASGCGQPAVAAVGNGPDLAAVPQRFSPRLECGSGPEPGGLLGVARNSLEQPVQELHDLSPFRGRPVSSISVHASNA